MGKNINNVNDIVKNEKEEKVIIDVTKSNKVIGMTDIIPNMRPVEKKDVETFIDNFKKEYNIKDKKDIKDDDNTSSNKQE